MATYDAKTDALQNQYKRKVRKSHHHAKRAAADYSKGKISEAAFRAKEKEFQSMMESAVVAVVCFQRSKYTSVAAHLANIFAALVETGKLETALEGTLQDLRDIATGNDDETIEHRAQNVDSFRTLCVTLPGKIKGTKQQWDMLTRSVFEHAKSVRTFTSAGTVFCNYIMKVAVTQKDSDIGKTLVDAAKALRGFFTLLGDTAGSYVETVCKPLSGFLIHEPTAIDSVTKGMVQSLKGTSSAMQKAQAEAERAAKKGKLNDSLSENLRLKEEHFREAHSRYLKQILTIERKKYAGFATRYATVLDGQSAATQTLVNLDEHTTLLREIGQTAHTLTPAKQQMVADAASTKDYQVTLPVSEFGDFTTTTQLDDAQCSQMNFTETADTFSPSAVVPPAPALQTAAPPQPVPSASSGLGLMGLIPEDLMDYESDAATTTYQSQPRSDRAPTLPARGGAFTQGTESYHPQMPNGVPPPVPQQTDNRASRAPTLPKRAGASTDVRTDRAPTLPSRANIPSEPRADRAPTLPKRMSMEPTRMDRAPTLPSRANIPCETRADRAPTLPKRGNAADSVRAERAPTLPSRANIPCESRTERAPTIPKRASQQMTRADRAPTLPSRANIPCEPRSDRAPTIPKRVSAAGDARVDRAPTLLSRANIPRDGRVDRAPTLPSRANIPCGVRTERAPTLPQRGDNGAIRPNRAPTLPSRDNIPHTAPEEFAFEAGTESYHPQMPSGLPPPIPSSALTGQPMPATGTGHVSFADDDVHFSGVCIGGFDDDEDGDVEGDDYESMMTTQPEEDAGLLEFAPQPIPSPTAQPPQEPPKKDFTETLFRSVVRRRTAIEDTYFPQADDVDSDDDDDFGSDTFGLDAKVKQSMAQQAPAQPSTGVPAPPSINGLSQTPPAAPAYTPAPARASMSSISADALLAGAQGLRKTEPKPSAPATNAAASAPAERDISTALIEAVQRSNVTAEDADDGDGNSDDEWELDDAEW